MAEKEIAYKTYQNFKKDFAGKRILIFGLGLLGRGVEVAKTFSSIGCQVTVTDLKDEKTLRASIHKLRKFPVKFTLGSHNPHDFIASDIIIRNPSVPRNHELLKLASQRNIPIKMDTSLFARYFPGKIIGITGTRGKTTTTLMIYQILTKTQSHPLILAGNTTQKANISLVKRATPETIAVMELSSWELQGFAWEKISPHISLVTNIYEDHLNRYSSMQEYAKDKESIFLFQKSQDYIFLNSSNPWTKKMSKKVKSKLVWFSEDDFPSSWHLPLPGKHNRENAAAALKVCKLFNNPEDKIRNIFSNFKTVPHRLEPVALINGIKFINDTTSTTPIATIKALQSINEPKIVLIGGNSKNLKIDQLIKYLSSLSKGIVFLEGNATPALIQKLKNQKNINSDFKIFSLKKAVSKAYLMAEPGDVILFSPAFTSFGEFNNEFERGNEFKSIVKKLKQNQ